MDRPSFNKKVIGICVLVLLGLFSIYVIFYVVTGPLARRHYVLTDVTFIRYCQVHGEFEDVIQLFLPHGVFEPERVTVDLVYDLGIDMEYLETLSVEEQRRLVNDEMNTFFGEEYNALDLPEPGICICPVQ